MKKIFTDILEAGVYPNLQEEEKKRIRLLNHLIVLSTIVIAIFATIDAFNGYYQMVVIASFVLAVAVLEQILVKKRKYPAAKFIVFFLILFTVCFTAVFVGKQTGPQYMLVPLAMVPLLIFNSRKTCAILFLVTFAAYVLVYYLQFNILPQLVLPSNLWSMYTIVSVFSMMAIIYLFTSYARSINESYEEIILKKNAEINEAYKGIKDSINYAKRIQEAILPPETLTTNLLPEHFILYEPKDIVSGDFYFVAKTESDTVLFAAVDCTGHGVPGAFMSIVGHNLLNQAVNENKKSEPAEILDEINKGLSQTLRQTFEQSSVKDGMDIALCSFDKTRNLLKFAGANNPVWIIRDNEIKEIKGNKFPIGMFVGEELQKFTNHEISLLAGDLIYIFTDGYSDQFGGEKGKKFKYSKLKELLLSIPQKPLQEQKEILIKTFQNWKGNLEQVDDVCIIGIRV